jgi:hypothetical protein
MNNSIEHWLQHHSLCFGIRGGHEKSAFKLVVKLSVVCETIGRFKSR